jgi:Phage integrase, N-terminal SAM-like domain
MHSHVRFNRGLVRQYHKWMKAMHYAGTTQTTYLKALHQYVGFMGQRSLARVKHTDIRLFVAQASENGATLSRVYRYLGILRQFYDFLNLGGVVVLLVRSAHVWKETRRWLLDPVLAESHLPTLVALLNRENDGFERFYVFPRIGADTRARITVRDPWLKSGLRVTDLARVCEAFENVRSAAT